MKQNKLVVQLRRGALQATRPASQNTVNHSESSAMLMNMLMLMLENHLGAQDERDVAEDGEVVIDDIVDLLVGK